VPWRGRALRGIVVTKAGRTPVQPAILQMRVVSIAWAKVMAGRTAVSRRASIVFPVPGEGHYGRH
jgi:hypothetical protein